MHHNHSCTIITSSSSAMSRQCLPSGQWGAVDFTTCTLRSGVSRPFTMYWSSLVDESSLIYLVGQIFPCVLIIMCVQLCLHALCLLIRIGLCYQLDSWHQHHL